MYDVASGGVKASGTKKNIKDWLYCGCGKSVDIPEMELHVYVTSINRAR